MTTYAYLHGFGSGPNARKAVELRAAFAARGLTLLTPNLAVPSFAKLSPHAGLEVIATLAREARARGERLALVASSMGGFLAATHAARCPDDIAALVLLCPGFDMPARFRALVGERRLRRWKKHDRIAYPDADNTLTAIHHALYTEMEGLDAFPAPPANGAPVTIIHGVRDEVVPIEVSRGYVAQHPGVRLVELDDDHRLHGSIPRVFEVVREAFGLPSE